MSPAVAIYGSDDATDKGCQTPGRDWLRNADPLESNRSMVTKYVRSEKFPPKNDGPPLHPISVEPGPVDQAILTVLAEEPFSSVPELSRLTCPPRSTVHGARAPD
jgi:hypothetical protein